MKLLFFVSAFIILSSFQENMQPLDEGVVEKSQGSGPIDLDENSEPIDFNADPIEDSGPIDLDRGLDPAGGRR